jgi:hypothetical protein
MGLKLNTKGHLHNRIVTLARNYYKEWLFWLEIIAF